MTAEVDAQFVATPIGVIHTPFASPSEVPIQAARSEAVGRVEVFSEYAPRPAVRLPIESSQESRVDVGCLDASLVKVVLICAACREQWFFLFHFARIYFLQLRRTGYHDWKSIFVFLTRRLQPTRHAGWQAGSS